LISLFLSDALVGPPEGLAWFAADCVFLAGTGSNREQRSIRTSLSGGRVEHGLQPVEVLEQHGLVWQQTLLRSTSCAHAQTRQEAAGLDVHKELGNLL
jgi:hypothetical protein